MRFTLDYFLLNAYLAIILPIAIYCLVLGQINRRPTGVMVNGVWDSIGLLFAGSGILLVTLPTLLVRQFAASMFDWYLAWIAYYLVLILGGGSCWSGAEGRPRSFTMSIRPTSIRWSIRPWKNSACPAAGSAIR